MALEAESLTNDQTPPIADRRSRRDRRGDSGRINRAAPRRSLLQRLGAPAVGIALGVVILMVIGSDLLLKETPWVALLAAVAFLVICIFAFLVGCIEQRLVEIRLELMMVNGGARNGDRDRRRDERSDLGEQIAVGPGVLRDWR